MATILVTGGAGYIGSHMTHALLDRGDTVVVLDNLSTGLRELVAPAAVFIQGDVGDIGLVRWVLREKQVDAIVHFAGSVVVPESVEHPLRYYSNNTANSCTLIEACIGEDVKRFIFSSTAAVYGLGDGTPAREDADTVPINPYGRSKLVTEWALNDAAHAYDFRYVALRYFNVAGADPRGRTGQSTPRATHLIKRACQVALDPALALDIFGTDFLTPDGTGVRDYVHVSDLIAAHILALDYLKDGGTPKTFNCGYGRGFSVRQVINAVSSAVGHALPFQTAPRRAGDPAQLIADATRLKTELGWLPRHDSLEDIVQTALTWERKCTNTPRDASRRDANTRRDTSRQDTYCGHFRRNTGIGLDRRLGI
jgi:UDP-glucose 4-epimerase